MAQKNKTTGTTASVADFLGSVKDETQRADSFRVAEMIESGQVILEMFYLTGYFAVS